MPSSVAAPRRYHGQDGSGCRIATVAITVAVAANGAVFSLVDLDLGEECQGRGRLAPPAGLERLHLIHIGDGSHDATTATEQGPLQRQRQRRRRRHAAKAGPWQPAEGVARAARSAWRAPRWCAAECGGSCDGPLRKTRTKTRRTRAMRVRARDGTPRRCCRRGIGVNVDIDGRHCGETSSTLVIRGHSYRQTNCGTLVVLGR